MIFPYITILKILILTFSNNQNNNYDDNKKQDNLNINKNNHSKI